MKKAIKAAKITALVTGVINLILMLLYYCFHLALIENHIYPVAAAITIISAISFGLLKMIEKGTMRMFSITITIILIVGIIGGTWIFLNRLTYSVEEHVSYNTADQKVYFESKGTFFMSNLPYYSLEEADIKLGIFYDMESRRIIKGGP